MGEPEQARRLPFCNFHEPMELTMAFRRGGFVLTPPSIWIFAISLVLALIAILVRYDWSVARMERSAIRG